MDFIWTRSDFWYFVFYQIIKIMFREKRCATIYAILGMMLTSIYSIIMGSTTLEILKEHLSFETFNILRGIIILGLED